MGLRTVKIVECNDCGVDSDEFFVSLSHKVVACSLREEDGWIVNDILTFGRCDDCERERLDEIQTKAERDKKQRGTEG